MVPRRAARKEEEVMGRALGGARATRRDALLPLIRVTPTMTAQKTLKRAIDCWPFVVSKEVEVYSFFFGFENSPCSPPV